MADRPIIFSGPMVRALIEGRKTQTRRVIKGVPDWADFASCVFAPTSLWQWSEPEQSPPRPLDRWPTDHALRLPYAPGDRLYVREHWRTSKRLDALPPRGIGDHVHIAYEADDSALKFSWGRFRQGMHMPRWASRLTLTVTDVRVQRLQDISAADSIAEGAECETCAAMAQSACHGKGCFASLAAFSTLWNSLHGPDAWFANPWLVALTFTVEQRNIDAGAA